MAEIKTKVTKVSVRDFIASVSNETRRKDAEALVRLFERVTTWKARMWGPTIIGFGRRRYAYASGRTGETLATGFSPRSSSIVFYVNRSFPGADALLTKLGNYKTGKGCTYVNKLADIDMVVLEKLLKSGVADTRKKGGVTAE